MRTEARIKSGFFPLPPDAIPHIAGKFVTDPQATIYDPCAGKGDAVIGIAEALGIPIDRVFATELDNGRHAELQQKLGSRAFEPLDFLSNYGSGQPSVMYCNPPFDDELGGGGRVEWRFLQRAAEYLAPGGILMAIVPERVASDYRTFEVLAGVLENLKAAELPIDRQYNECLMVGVKRKAKVQPSYWDHRSIMVDFEEFPVYQIPKGTAVTIRKRFYSQHECYELAAKSAANVLLETASVREERTLKPPMRLTQGHIALLLASGYLDGIVEVPGEEPHVVRGSARKVVTERKEESGGGVKVIKTEQIQLTVKVADTSGVRVLEDKIENQTEEESGDEANDEGE